MATELVPLSFMKPVRSLAVISLKECLDQEVESVNMATDCQKGF